MEIQEFLIEKAKEHKISVIENIELERTINIIMERLMKDVLERLKEKGINIWERSL